MRTVYNPVPLYLCDKAGQVGADMLLLYFTIEAPQRVGQVLDMARTGAPFDGAFTRGLFFKGGPEYVALIFARSSLGARHGVALPNGVGVIDSDYRGEVHVALANHGDEAYVIQPGERVAQMAVVPVAHAVLQEVGELGGTARGEGGFGSTGKL